MKNYIFTLLTLTSLLPIILLGQSIDQTAIKRETAPPIGVLNAQDNNQKSGIISPTDAGAQQPIRLNTSPISVFGGYNTNYDLRSNPLTGSGSSRQRPSWVWSNSFFAGGSLQPIDLDVAVVAPMVGASWTMSDYLNDYSADKSGQGIDYGTLNDYTTSAYALLMIRHESGWSFRTGTSYASVRLTEKDTETFREFYPNIGAMNMFSVDADTLAIVDISGGFHITDSDPVSRSNIGNKPGSRKELDNWDLALSVTLLRDFYDFTISPSYRLAMAGFTYNSPNNITYSLGKATMEDRFRLDHNFAIKIEYTVMDELKIALNTSYTNSNSSNTPADFDNKSYNFGAHIGINLSF